MLRAGFFLVPLKVSSSRRICGLLDLQPDFWKVARWWFLLLEAPYCQNWLKKVKSSMMKQKNNPVQSNRTCWNPLASLSALWSEKLLSILSSVQRTSFTESYCTEAEHRDTLNGFARSLMHTRVIRFQYYAKVHKSSFLVKTLTSFHADPGSAALQTICHSPRSWRVL